MGEGRSIGVNSRHPTVLLLSSRSGSQTWIQMSPYLVGQQSHMPMNFWIPLAHFPQPLTQASCSPTWHPSPNHSRDPPPRDWKSLTCAYKKVGCTRYGFVLWDAHVQCPVHIKPRFRIKWKKWLGRKRLSLLSSHSGRIRKLACISTNILGFPPKSLLM